MSFQWTDRNVRTALGLAPSDVEPDLVFAGVCTDSRMVKPGDLFVALEGETFDGHDFVQSSFAAGAAGAVVAGEVSIDEERPLYRVLDTTVALGDLAHHRRNTLDARVVGITGSSGKTGTKDLLAATLRGRLRVHATKGNFNNRIGLPLTLLDAPDDAQALVLEMGTNEPGEIGALTSVAAPGVGVITTVGETHLEKLGSVEGVLDEKLDLFRGLPSDGVAVVGDEPAILEQAARGVASTLLVTGWSDRAGPENRPEAPDVMDNGCYRFRWRGEPVALAVPGRHSVQNALIALAVADIVGVPPAEAVERIGQVRPGGMRSEVRKLGGLTLLVDCYNANPQSLAAALDLVTSIAGPGSRIAVLGSMLELGGDSAAIHERALRNALTFSVDVVVATGLFAEAAEALGPMPETGPEVVVASDLAEAGAALLGRLEGTETILLKASRGVAMEVLIPELEKRFGEGKAA